jgi:SPP1 gp7 family putative phage head morphogenesis protein
MRLKNLDRGWRREETLRAAFLRMCAKLERKQAESLAIQLSRGVKPENLILDAGIVAKVAALTEQLLKDAAAIGTSVAREFIAEKQAAAGFSFAAKPDPSAFIPEGGLEWYRKAGLELVGVVNQDALDRTKKIIEEGIRNGDPTKDIMAKLRLEHPDFAANRLENIARTETAEVYEQASVSEYEAEDSIVAYEVVATIDSRTTAVCRHRNGMVIPKDKVNGWKPPYHYFCRTQLVPVFDFENQDVTPKAVREVGPQPFDGFGARYRTFPATKDKAAQKLIARAGRRAS